MRSLLWGALFLARALGANSEVPVVNLVGSINRGNGNYVVSQIEKAEKTNAPYLLIVLDTPGGLLSTTRRVVQKILETPVPIAVFVGPGEAQASAASALIALAADASAMAPNASLGGSLWQADKNEKVSENTSVASDSDALAETIAKTRGLNRDGAVKSVREYARISSEEALKQGLVDLIEQTPDDFSKKLNGFRFKSPKGNLTQFPEGVFVLSPKPIGLFYQAASLLANPRFAYLMLSLSAVCFWLWFYHPGRKTPAFVGALCFAVSLASLQLLPVNYGAFGLIVAGLCFILAELFFPTYGLMGIGGTLSYLFGSLFLMDTTAPDFQVPLNLVLPTTAGLVAIASGLAFKLFKRRRASPLMGSESLIGQYAEVKELVTAQKGKVFVQGELWSAFSSAEELEFSKGSVVVVQKVEGVNLVVGPSQSL